MITARPSDANACITKTASDHDQRFYIKGNLIFPTRLRVEDYNADFRLDGAATLGWNFHKHFSAEIEGAYLSAPLKTNVSSRADVDTAGLTRKIESFNAFANVLYHVSPHNHFNPFVGVGFGVGKHKTSNLLEEDGTPLRLSPSASNNHFIYQVMLGLEWVAHHNVSFLIDTRWLGLGKAKTIFGDTVCNKSFTAQTLSIGVKVKF